ncbi:hypothetical protein MnTg04_01524 [bacterium MnTg04]|nr:hypothetical protein MnTg04_01524 [bacterium MnTg04]
MNESGKLISAVKTSATRLCPGALEIWAVLAGSIVTAVIASSLANWAFSEQTQLLSAISFTAALVWIYGILLAGSGRKALLRLALVIGIVVLAASGNTDLIAASFLAHGLATAQVSSELSIRQEKVALLAWTGASLTLAVLTLVGLS